MKLDMKKRMAARVLKTSPKKVVFDETKLDEIKEAITLQDMRSLAKSSTVRKRDANEQSHGRTRARHDQKAKGRRRGLGKRKGTANARKPGKDAWMDKIRSQREFIRELREKGVVSTKTFRSLYLKCKGGFFRSRRHINLFLTEKGLKEKK